jgi:large repetitive protein
MKKGLYLILALMLAIGALIPMAGAISGEGGGNNGTTLTASVTADAVWSHTFDWTINKSVDINLWQFEVGDNGISNYTVTLTKDSGTIEKTISGSVTITNGGVLSTEDLAISLALTIPPSKDVLLSSNVDVSGKPVLAPGETWVYPYTITLVDPTAGANYKVTANVTITNHSNYLGLPNGPSPSDTTNFPGSVALVNNTVHVTDTNGMDWSFSDSDSVVYSRTFTADEAGSFIYPNTATITETGANSSCLVTVEAKVKANPAQDLMVTTTAAGSFDRAYLWGISKTVDKNTINIPEGNNAEFNYMVNVNQTGIIDSAWTAAGEISVYNPNTFDIEGVNVTDSVNNGGTAIVTGGNNVMVAAGQTVVLPYTVTYDSAPDYNGVNTATATWDQTAYLTPSGSAVSSAEFALVQNEATNKTVNITDTLVGSLGSVTATEEAPFATGTFTYQQIFPGVAGTSTTYDNTATIVETDQSASQTVKVNVGKDLTVSKTAAGTFDRTYLWDISKSVDKLVVKQIGGNATFNYTVNVKQTGYADSGWKLSGTITIINPNDWEDIVVDVTDLVDNGGTAFITNGLNVSIPKSGFVTLDYVVGYPVAPGNYSGINTATAAWDKATFSTPDGTATGSAEFTLAQLGSTNQTVNITDSFAGWLGTLTATDAAPWASASYTYPRTVPVPSWNSVSYDNTATIVETKQSASVTVKVYGPAQTGALSMGYWQNKNGQAIITGGSSVSGVAKSGTWLRQFMPFQDLSTTATPAQVATYVTNIIKAANASGSSMNSMLKSQMLAAALDVFFSDPALGGNKIGAPAPIGTAAIDLTNIKGNLNVSGAFGGATHLTILQMLSFASSQSNSGGTLWYSNVKATQSLAKDAFDAIVNQLVFAW